MIFGGHALLTRSITMVQLSVDKGKGVWACICSAKKGFVLLQSVSSFAVVLLEKNLNIGWPGPSCVKNVMIDESL